MFEVHKLPATVMTCGGKCCFGHCRCMLLTGGIYSVQASLSNIPPKSALLVVHVISAWVMSLFTWWVSTSSTSDPYLPPWWRYA